MFLLEYKVGAFFRVLALQNKNSKERFMLNQVILEAEELVNMM